MKTLMTATLVLALAHTLSAQPSEIYSGDGWLAFPMVEYQGGDATVPKKHRGMLVLTADALSLRDCKYNRCWSDNKGREPFAEKAYLTIPLSSIQRINGVTNTSGPTTGDKLLLGGLAGSKSDGLVTVVYATQTSAESPIFKATPAQAAAIEVKVKYQLQQRGAAVQD